MAASTSSLAARRAGQLAATSPSTAASSEEHHKVGRRHDGVGDALLFQRRHQRDAHAGTDDDPDDGAEDGQDDRFGPDHRPDLAPLHADRPEQADLAGAFEHREHERVHDPDERDKHGQREQGVDQAEELVDAGRLGLLELSPGLDLHVRVGGQGAGDGLVHARRCRWCAAGPRPDPGSEVSQEEADAGQVASDQGVRLVDPADAHHRRTRLREPHRNRVAHRQVLRLRGRRVDEQLTLGQGGRGARRHAQDQRVGQVLRRHPSERGQRVLQLKLATGRRWWSR